MPPADIEREIHHKDYDFKDLVRKKNNIKI